MDRDEAFYYLYGDDKPEGAVQTHVDDFEIAGTANFIKKIIDGLSKKLTISKIARGKF